ncbi:hypothetical protein [Streptomyces hilarionis]|nr:hypothetical protein [Streptomyces hilarionis]
MTAAADRPSVLSVCVHNAAGGEVVRPIRDEIAKRVRRLVEEIAPRTRS